MKVLLIHSDTENDDCNRLKLFLEKMDINVDVFPVVEDMYGSIVKQFIDFFSCPVNITETKGQILTPQTEITSHVVILSSLSYRWLDFFLGFSCGFHVPIIVHGKNAVERIPEECASSFTLLKNEDSLKEYFEAEYEVYKKHEAALETGKARENLLQLGIPINDEAFAGCVGHGRIEEVKLFLDAGFSPDARNKTGIPMLNIAARKGQAAMIQLLIQSGAQLNQLSDDRKSSALFDGALGKHVNAVKELIEAGAELNIQSNDGQTALTVSIGSSCEEIIEALLKAGADPDIADKLGMSARKYATFFKKPAVLSLFDKYSPV